MTRDMANSPATLEAYLQFTSALEDGSLDATFRELIASGTAEMNQCEYCLSAHSAIDRRPNRCHDYILKFPSRRSCDDSFEVLEGKRLGDDWVIQKVLVRHQSFRALYGEFSGDC